MADIGNLTGISIRPNQDLSTADIEHQSKQTIQGALPASLAPQPTLAQAHLVGGMAQISDRLRLETLGQPSSTGVQVKYLSSALERLKLPSQGHKFANIEAQMEPILTKHFQYMRQIMSELSHGRT
ncbi:MAG: hypothetical protein WCK49_07595 [Myxococcaceae bacterium]